MNMAIAQGPNTWRTIAVRGIDGEASQGNWMEHRWGPRRPCRARVSISAGSGLAGSGRMRDVSLSGAFLETVVPLPMFTRLAIAVLPDDGGSAHSQEFTAVVVRRDEGGVGIEWCDEIYGSICRALGCNIQCGYAAAPGK
jgi:hypothetical protein